MAHRIIRDLAESIIQDLDARIPLIVLQGPEAKLATPERYEAAQLKLWRAARYSLIGVTPGTLGQLIDFGVDWDLDSIVQPEKESKPSNGRGLLRELATKVILGEILRQTQSQLDRDSA